jgi:hypothetical protein
MRATHKSTEGRTNKYMERMGTKEGYSQAREQRGKDASD